MSTRRITIQLSGSISDNEHVRLADFLVQFHALRIVFANLERVVSGSDSPSIYFRIVDLSHRSPATITLEAHDASLVGEDRSEPVIKKFFEGLQQIRDGQPSKEYDRNTLEAFKGLGATLRKHVTQIRFSSDHYQIEYSRFMQRNIDRILGPEQIQSGSITGRLDAINVHNRVNKFYIYPNVGPKKVICHFPESMVGKAIAAIQHHVEVLGNFKYKRRDFFPHEVEVDQLRVFPPISELPTLRSLKGIAPNATGDLDSVAFVRERRNARA